MPAVERTLVLIKPDAVANGWTEEIIKHYVAAGLLVVRRDEAVWDRDQAEVFYEELKDEFFFTVLRLAMTSGPLVAVELEGDDAVSKVRVLNGPTDPSEASPTTIRGMYKSGGGPFNAVHASDSTESAEREIRHMERWGIFK